MFAVGNWDDKSRNLPSPARERICGEARGGGEARGDVAAAWCAAGWRRPPVSAAASAVARRRRRSSTPRRFARSRFAGTATRALTCGSRPSHARRTRGSTRGSHAAHARLTRGPPQRARVAAPRPSPPGTSTRPCTRRRPVSDRRKAQEEVFFLPWFLRRRGRSDGRFRTALGGLPGGFSPDEEATREVRFVSCLSQRQAVRIKGAQESAVFQFYDTLLIFCSSSPFAFGECLCLNPVGNWP